MTLLGKILIVDDDSAFLRTYNHLLGSEGYQVETATDRSSALAMLDQADWDLVLLDMKLQGGNGPNEGIDLLSEVQVRAPMAKAILVTAYASPESVEHAFTQGAYDYLEKNELFSALLRIKTRNALEATRERRFAGLANGKREETVKALWQDVQTEKNRKRKGRLLEALLLVLIKSIPGFERADVNERSQDEEFDLVVPNESPDLFWGKESQYFLVECKHWSAPVDPHEIDRFHQKLERRHGRCQLGFFVALRGFTAGVAKTLGANRKEPIAIVVLQAAELQRLIDAGSGLQRNEILKEIHRKTVLRG